ncbi:MAG TPA: PBP1A family penicillin-binding protein [Candidatus Binataceae bacterium]|nr:PBP1A family penicillin-binding protein [Candidatus Binataceae bacterium]
MQLRRILKIALIIMGVIVLFASVPVLWTFYNYYRALDDEVVARFSGKRWNIPSRIYSDSTLVYPGQNLDDLGVFQRLARLNYHPVDTGKVNSRGEYSYDRKTGRMVLFLHNFSYPYGESNGELVELVLKDGTIQSMTNPQTHQPMNSFELEPELLSGIFEGDWEQRRLVSLSQVPQLMIDAILAAEDHRFYDHHGVDLVRTIKAAWVDMISRHVRQGGSTLTQQLMKNFFLTRERSYKRKIKEAMMAIVAERRYSKDEILENYVNDIYLGQRGQEGIYGIWEAGEFYFSKEPRDLTIGEMATIAGMISSPNRLNPLKHPADARKRRNEVLASMLQDGYISKAAYDQAAAEPLHPREVFTENSDAPYFVDYVKKELAERYPPQVLSGEGLRIFTTLDVHMEKVAEHAIEQNLLNLEDRHPKLVRREENQSLQSCLLSLEPQSGKIRAMVGGRDYRESQFDRITQSHRQPGSVFKPVTYLAAFDETLSGGPDRFLPTTYIEDAPFTWQYGNGNAMSWTPNNYRDRFFGHVMLEFALAESLNSATARLASSVGLDRVRAMAAKLGFGDLPPYPSIVLGGIEVTPMQVAHAYSIIANDGMEVQPFAVTAVVGEDGKVIEGHELSARQVLSPQLAYMMQFMLEQVINHGTGAGARSAGFRRPAAGKTGTTNDAKDAWFAGFTPNLLTVVWTGFDQKEELGLTGAQASLPAWTEFMKAATASRPALDFNVPPGMVEERVDPTTGYRATDYCPDAVDGVFPVGMAPIEYCPYHRSPSAIPASDHAMPEAPDSSAEPND